MELRKTQEEIQKEYDERLQGKKEIEQEYHKKMKKLSLDFFGELDKKYDSYFVNHMHICQFDLEQHFPYPHHAKGWNVRKCKEYLKSRGMTRDRELWCCDTAGDYVNENIGYSPCRYMKTIYFDSDGEILFIV